MKLSSAQLSEVESAFAKFQTEQAKRDPRAKELERLLHEAVSVSDSIGTGVAQAISIDLLQIIRNHVRYMS